jgi:hypothetical protein
MMNPRELMVIPVFRLLGSLVGEMAKGEEAQAVRDAGISGNGWVFSSIMLRNKKIKQKENRPLLQLMIYDTAETANWQRDTRDV